ncbi:MAG: protocatechuate 3,4-dioxygenase [Alphaproteobacteria bacterium]|nr:protocatechuate 3,4-dioxygenase [Alphaproteobacteria bacterium]
MAWEEKPYHKIPGTYVFDGKRSANAYKLNKMLFSFNREENRKAYEADPATYADKYGLPADQKEALLKGDFLELLRQGGNIYYMAKLAIPAGFSVQDVGAAFHNIPTDDFKQHLLDQSEDFQKKLKDREGYWHG